MRDNFYLCVFKTRNKAMQLYTTLESKGFQVFRLVITPCGIMAGCNYGIKFSNKNYLDVIFKESQELGMEIPTVYYAKRGHGNMKYTKLNIN